MRGGGGCEFGTLCPGERAKYCERALPCILFPLITFVFLTRFARRRFAGSLFYPSVVEAGLGVGELLKKNKKKKEKEMERVEEQKEIDNSSSLVTIGMSERTAVAILTGQVLSVLDWWIFPDSSCSTGPSASPAASPSGASTATATAIAPPPPVAHGLLLVRSTLGLAYSSVPSPSTDPDTTTIRTIPFLHLLVQLTLLPLCVGSDLRPTRLPFLHSCGRLRCLTGWVLRLAKSTTAFPGMEEEGSLSGVGLVVRGGGSIPFQAWNEEGDRICLAIVLVCHGALEKCGRMVSVIEAEAEAEAEGDNNAEKRITKKKTIRRVLRSAHELKELVGSIFATNGEALRVGLDPKAWKALSSAIKDGNLTELMEGKGSGSGSSTSSGSGGGREGILRRFLNDSWVRRWHEEVKVNDKDNKDNKDNKDKGKKETERLIPAMVSNGQTGGTGAGSVAGVLGRKAVTALSLQDLGGEPIHIQITHPTSSNPARSA